MVIMGGGLNVKMFSVMLLRCFEFIFFLQFFFPQYTSATAIKQEIIFQNLFNICNNNKKRTKTKSFLIKSNNIFNIHSFLFAMSCSSSACLLKLRLLNIDVFRFDPTRDTFDTCESGVTYPFATASG